LKTPITPQERDEILLELISIDARIDHVHQRIFDATDESNAVARRMLQNYRSQAHCSLVAQESYLLGLSGDRPFSLTEPGKLSQKHPQQHKNRRHK
jgi:hypothetical protein